MLAVHEAQIAEHGGSQGVRDLGLLESALARPRQYAERRPLPRDIAFLAALYGIAIVRNHPFLDGNKRVGLVAVELFLELNGYRFVTDDASCVNHVLALAAGEEADAEFTEWVRAHARTKSGRK
jgi:death-on-curing protein